MKFKGEEIDFGSYTMTNQELQTAVDTAIAYLKENDNASVKKTLEELFRIQAARAAHVVFGNEVKSNENR